MHIVARVTATVFAVLSLLHLYWMIGGRRGMSAVLPEAEGRPLIQPGAFASAIVALLLAIAAWLVLERAGLGPGWATGPLLPVATWGVAGVMLARSIGEFRYLGFFKRVKGSRFARLDSRFFSPLALALALGSGWVALRGG
jgi:hypothetical protein